MPANENLIPISLNPAVKALTNKSINMNAIPKNITKTPTVINALNNDKFVLFDI